MLMTATQAAGFMIQRYDLEGAARIIENEGLVLLPTDTLWCIACAADDPVAVERLRRLKTPSLEQPYEILFASLDMLKAYAPRLHPRLETLLVYHLRPLTILTEASPVIRPHAIFADGRMAARITRDNYCRSLIQLVNRPLLTSIAHYSGSPYPSHFGRLRSDIVEGIDYVSKYRPKESATARPTIIVQMDELDELDFLRE
ncbi:MAG: hypothetical protein DA408_15060 [Bacteroidetes bacterium]|nr:MAG: hypothetical protein DA408_15060 [Bacteroidota bacterium]